MGLRISGCGWWEYDRKQGEGRFVCTHEGREEAYQLRRVKRWITLLYVPVIPLGTLGTYVKCKSCKTKYSTDVVARATEAAATPTPPGSP